MLYSYVQVSLATRIIPAPGDIREARKIRAVESCVRNGTSIGITTSQLPVVIGALGVHACYPSTMNRSRAGATMK